MGILSYSKAPVVVPALYHVPYYYGGYHLIGKRSAEPQPMDQFQADPRFARHMPSPYMRSRREAEPLAAPEATPEAGPEADPEAEAAAKAWYSYYGYGYGYGYPYYGYGYYGYPYYRGYYYGK